jgi:hypothetical protein
MPPRDPIMLPPGQHAILRRYRASLPGPRREIFDRAVRDSLRGEIAPAALSVAASRAFDVAMAAPPPIPAIFRKDIP